MSSPFTETLVMGYNDLPSWVSDFLIDTTWCKCNNDTYLWADQLERDESKRADWEKEDILCHAAACEIKVMLLDAGRPTTDLAHVLILW